MSEYSYEIFNRPLTSSELTYLGEIAIWNEFIRLQSLPVVNVALQELLRRHHRALCQLASMSHKRNSFVSDLDDKRQHAIYGAMQAYSRFDYNFAVEHGTRLSTYINQSVYRYLQSCNDSDSFINCPDSCRLMRSYLCGKFDNDIVKKNEIEKRFKINNSEDIQALRNKYAALIPIYSPIEEAYPNDREKNRNFLTNNSPSDNDLINVIQMQNYMKYISERQKLVIENLVAGYTMNEIADNLNVSEGVIRGDVRTIRTIIKRENERNINRDKKFFV